ncbi:hypothetical protein LCGC14_0381740 [marine sediment metagenome]|uniref:Uncharacterized protein n=1 Tax=marine sediment metagenome TaxID=412755 RepID=A0A0F9TKD8_9ZZZZ
MSIENNAHPQDSSLFSENPLANLPETIEDDQEEESSEQNFELPEYAFAAAESSNEGSDASEEDIQSTENSVEESTELVPEQNFELPEAYSYDDLDDEFGGEGGPPGFRQMFDPKGRSDLTKMTETPPRMILPLVRAKIIDAAYDEERIARGESLLSIFVTEFDKRMISKDRKGRLEAVELIRGLHKGDGTDEEEASL